MPCTWVKLPGGGVAIVKHARAPRSRCRHCGAGANLLCDFPTAPGKTCDAPICARCSTPGGTDVDYCRDHAPAPAIA